jgi:hypothetical protein
VFYESVHLNRNFISALTHAATEFTSEQSMNSTSAASVTAADTSAAAAAAVIATVPLTPTAANAPSLTLTSSLTAPANLSSSQNVPLELDLNNMRLLNPHSSLLSAASPGGVGGVAELSSVDEQLEAAQPNDPPSNLLVIFLQACSAILQETKIETNNVYDTIKLFMLVLVCISEDQYANSILHDSNVLYSVFLYQAVRLIQQLCFTPD